MSEDEKFSVDTEKLKNETKETVNQVKDTIKNVDFKKDTEETKGFLKEMFSDPFEAVRKVASGEENVLKKAIMIMIIFIAASVVYELISLIKYGKYSGIGDNLLDLVASVLNPIFYIVVPSLVILIMNKNSKKSLTTVISTLVVTSVPVVINHIIDIIEILVSGITIISGPISTALSAVALVLTYFGMKDLFEENDDSSFIKKYAIIKLVAAFVLVILGRIGIY